MECEKTTVFIDDERNVYTDFGINDTKFKAKMALLGDVNLKYRQCKESDIPEIISKSHYVFLLNPFDHIDKYGFAFEILYKLAGSKFGRVIPVVNNKRIYETYGRDTNMLVTMGYTSIDMLMDSGIQEVKYTEAHEDRFTTPFIYGIYKLWEGIEDKKALIEQTLFHSMPYSTLNESDLTKIVINWQELSQLISGDALANALRVYERFRAVKAMIPSNISTDILNLIVRFSGGRAFPVYYYARSDVFKEPGCGLREPWYNTIILFTPDMTAEQVMTILGGMGLLYMGIKDKPYWTF